MEYIFHATIGTQASTELSPIGLGTIKFLFGENKCDVFTVFDKYTTEVPLHEFILWNIFRNPDRCTDPFISINNSSKARNRLR